MEGHQGLERRSSILHGSAQKEAIAKGVFRIQILILVQQEAKAHIKNIKVTL